MADKQDGFLRRQLLGSHPARIASRHLLSLCNMSLQVRLHTIAQTSGLQKEIYDEAQRIVSGIETDLVSGKSFDTDERWIEVYKVERLLDLLLSDERLKHRIEAVLSEMESGKAPEAPGYRSDHQKMEQALVAATGTADEVRRDFLTRALESLQWFYRTRDLARPVRRAATKIILVCGLFAAAMVVAPYVALPFCNLTEEAINAARWWTGVWQMLPLYTALSSGLLGAFFSRLIFMQQNVNLGLDDVFLQRELSYTLLRAGVGMCGALIVYLFLRSGIVEGAVFPHFDKIAIEQVIVPLKRDSATNVPMKLLIPSRDLALLIVWSFIAGFSKVLVPAILARTAEQFSNAATIERK
jgi:hypothetical protein